MCVNFDAGVGDPDEQHPEVAAKPDVAPDAQIWRPSSLVVLASAS